MFSIRDSVEPEDGFEGNDIFLASSNPPATHATPISFDLPSTTSAATQPSSTNIPTQKHKTPKATDSNPPKRRRTVGVESRAGMDIDDDIWEFTVESPEGPPRTRRSKTVEAQGRKSTRKPSSGEEDTPQIKRHSRRNSTNGIADGSAKRNISRRHSRQIEESSPISLKTTTKKRKPTIQDEDSDTERIESPSPQPEPLHFEEPFSPDIREFSIALKEPESESENAFDDILAISSSRKSTIAVEVPSKPRRRSRHKTPLEEVAIQNLITPETSPQKPNFKDNAPQSSPNEVMESAEDEVDNVAVVNLPPTTPVKRTMQESVEKAAIAMSPPRQLNVASILAKSPNRPMYRVGLSRRVNVEPLHGYLKRNAS
jgi:hypothetical protein